MVVSENNPDKCKTLKISIDVIIKDPEMLRLVPDHLKTKKMCKNAVKKLPFVTRYDLDRYKTQKICNKVILENDGTLNFVPYC